MRSLRFLLPFVLLAGSATPSLAGWLDETVNGTIEQVGRATLSPQSLPRSPDDMVQSLKSQIQAGAAITPQAANDLLSELRGLDRDRLETIAANVSTCVIVDCRGVPADRVASLADRIIGALQDAADQRADLWSRGVSIISVLIALLSLTVNVVLTVNNRRSKTA